MAQSTVICNACLPFFIFHLQILFLVSTFHCACFTLIFVVCRVAACKCLAPVQPIQAALPAQQRSRPEEDFPVLGHPFNSLQEWDPSHEASLDLEHLWQVPPGMLLVASASSSILQQGFIV